MWLRYKKSFKNISVKKLKKKIVVKNIIDKKIQFSITILLIKNKFSDKIFSKNGFKILLKKSQNLC